MSGLGHYLEDEGVATVSISLVREHTAAIGPPRALWVPFPLGRPLGAPGDAAFQRRVLLAAFGLLSQPEGPVLEDFAEEAPEVAAGDGEPWACPIALQPTSTGTPLADAFLAEMAEMLPWYERVAAKQGTTVGASGLAPEDCAKFLAACLGGASESPNDRSFAEITRAIAEDVKALYFEAAAEQPATRRASAEELLDWFWGETRAGKVLLTLKNRFSESSDEDIALLGNLLLVPASQRDRAEAVRAEGS